MTSPWSLLYGLLLDKASLAKALTSELMLMKGRARASIANSTCASSVMPCATVIVVQTCDLRSTRHMHIYENHWKSTRVLIKEKLPELGHRWLQDWNSYLGRSIWKYSVSDRDSDCFLNMLSQCHGSSTAGAEDLHPLRASHCQVVGQKLCVVLEHRKTDTKSTQSNHSRLHICQGAKACR